MVRFNSDWVMVGPFILRAPAVTAHNAESDPALGGCWSGVRVDQVELG